MSDEDNLDELDIMFLWSEEGYLCLILQSEDGSFIEYEFDEAETLNLLEFLQKKYKNISKTAKVIETLTDNTNKKKK